MRQLTESVLHPYEKEMSNLSRQEEKGIPMEYVIEVTVFYRNEPKNKHLIPYSSERAARAAYKNVNPQTIGEDINRADPEAEVTRVDKRLLVRGNAERVLALDSSLIASKTTNREKARNTLKVFEMGQT
jgi:hypothetical protein